MLVAMAKLVALFPAGMVMVAGTWMIEGLSVVRLTDSATRWSWNHQCDTGPTGMAADYILTSGTDREHRGRARNPQSISRIRACDPPDVP